MRRLKAIGSQLGGLFVDDAAFALSIMVWLVASGLVLPRLGLSSTAPSIMLFAGLVVILGFSVVQQANKIGRVKCR